LNRRACPDVAMHRRSREQGGKTTEASRPARLSPYPLTPCRYSPGLPEGSERAEGGGEREQLRPHGLPSSHPPPHTPRRLHQAQPPNVNHTLHRLHCRHAHHPSCPRFSAHRAAYDFHTVDRCSAAEAANVHPPCCHHRIWSPMPPFVPPLAALLSAAAA
jgi:hypothetical protein